MGENESSGSFESFPICIFFKLGLNMTHKQLFFVGFAQVIADIRSIVLPYHFQISQNLQKNSIARMNRR